MRSNYTCAISDLVPRISLLLSSAKGKKTGNAVVPFRVVGLVKEARKCFFRFVDYFKGNKACTILENCLAVRFCVTFYVIFGHG